MVWRKEERQHQQKLGWNPDLAKKKINPSPQICIVITVIFLQDKYSLPFFTMGSLFSFKQMSKLSIQLLNVFDTLNNSI